MSVSFRVDRCGRAINKTDAKKASVPKNHSNLHKNDIIELRESEHTKDKLAVHMSGYDSASQ
jgi:predicted RNA-binding protein with PUA domain